MTVTRAGGIAGLVTRTVLDEATLPRDEAQELHRRVERARADDRERPRASRPGGPDELGIELLIEAEEGRQTIRGGEGQLSDPERQLLDWVAASPHSEHYVSAPGGSG
ncbi:MAG TPA: protealysin inhibitor emfourin [Solirubrobacteraceae bacterium]|nr:protealysin inhibitor emfourin [Solirubrobacteraceae bacterium]